MSGYHTISAQSWTSNEVLCLHWSLFFERQRVKKVFKRSHTNNDRITIPIKDEYPAKYVIKVVKTLMDNLEAIVEDQLVPYTLRVMLKIV